MIPLDFCIFEGIASIICCTTLICCYAKKYTNLEENDSETDNLLYIKDNSYNLLQIEKLKLLPIKKQPQQSQTFVLLKNNL